MLGQAFADGILTGAIIALGAIGISLGLQILRFANFAHSELLTWGGYIALIFVSFAGPGTPTGPLSFGWQLIAAMIFAAALTGCLAWFVDFLVFKRLRSRDANPLTMVFAGFGAALVMRNLIVLFWGQARTTTRANCRWRSRFFRDADAAGSDLHSGPGPDRRRRLAPLI